MERSTIRTILLVVGSAIGGIVLFVAAISGYVVYTINTKGHGEISIPGGPYEGTETVSVPPEFKERFLGAHGSYRGDSRNYRNKVLATGPGKILGTVTSSGKPVPGFRVRLALNDGVMSEWAVTDEAGRYAVSVPYGKYRVDGYEIDSTLANKLLSGKINAPDRPSFGEDNVFTLAEGKTGRGVDLEFVDPVRKKGPGGQVSLSKPVVIEWEAYPGASQYEIQITEALDPRDYQSFKQLFECCSRPKISGTSFNLSERGIKLKKNYGYFVEITALDAKGKSLANSPSRHMTPDFSTTD